MALNLQLFRNATLFASRELARKGLEAELAKSADGEIVLARYGSGVPDVKTIFGIAFNQATGAEGNSSYTIFDLEDIKKGSCLTSAKFNDVVGAITQVADGLSLTFKVLSKDITVGAGYEPVVLGTITGGTLSDPIAVGDTIQSALHKLEVDVQGLVFAINAEKARAEGKEQANANAISAETTRAKAAEKANADAITAETTRAKGQEATLQGGITTNSGEIDKLKKLVGTTSVGDQITAKINVLDSTSSGTGSFVTGVSQTNGIVSVTKGKGDAVDVKVASITGITSTDVQGALKELKEDINGQATAGVVTVEALGSPEGGAAKTYVVKQGGTKVGVSINIPKDMVVQSGAIVKGTWDRDRTTFTPSEEGSDIALKLTIGNGSPVYVDVKQLVDAYTGKNGISVSNLNEISVKINATGNEFLEVGADGLRVTGVNAAITSKVNTAIGNLDVKDAAVATDYVSSVSQTDGKIKVTRAKLPVIPVIGDATKSGTSADGHVKVDVTTTKGVVSAVAVTGTDIASAATVQTIKDAYFAKANVTTTVPSDGVGVDTKVMSEKLVVAELKKKQVAGDYATNSRVDGVEGKVTTNTNSINGLKSSKFDKNSVTTALPSSLSAASDEKVMSEKLVFTELGKKATSDSLTALTNRVTTNEQDIAKKIDKTVVESTYATITSLNNGLDKKVDKVSGSRLITNAEGDQIATNKTAIADLKANKLDKTGPIDCGTY